MKNSAIRVVGRDLSLPPSYFSQPWVMRHIAGLKAIHVYTELRAMGHGPHESFYAAFEKLFIAHPDAAAYAMECFESSEFYQRCLELVLQGQTSEYFESHWIHRGKQFTGVTRIHAKTIEVHLPRNADEVFGEYKAGSETMPFEYAQHVSNQDREAMDAFIAAREKQTAQDRLDEARGWTEARSDIDMRNPKIGHGVVFNDRGVPVVY